MTDEELQAWHAKTIELRNYQTLSAHVRASGGPEEKKNEPKRDISEYE
jgi:hypothetical protein